MNTRKLPLATLAACLMFAMSMPAPAGAEPVKLRLTADPGDVQRVDAPVLAVLKVGSDLPAEQVESFGPRLRAKLVPEGGGAAVPAQAQVIVGADGKAESVVVGWVVRTLDPGKPASYELTLEPAP